MIVDSRMNGRNFFSVTFDTYQLFVIFYKTSEILDL